MFDLKKIKRTEESSTNQKRHNPTVKRKRCQKCFETHFPLPKFCRWNQSSNFTPKSPLIKDDLKSKYKHQDLYSSFFENSPESANLQNLYDNRYLMKLKS